MFVALLLVTVSLVVAQLNEVQGFEYLSMRFQETGLESAIYDMVVGDINYTFPSNYSTSDKIASVMMSSEQVLESETLTYGPGGVIILEEPTNPELYAYLLGLFSGRPDNGTYTENMFDQQELDSYVTHALDAINVTLAKRRNPKGWMCAVNLWGCKSWDNCRIMSGGAKDRRCVCGTMGRSGHPKVCYDQA